MKSFRSCCSLALSVLVACLVGLAGGRAAAQTPAQILATWAVVPATSPGFVEIGAVVVEAELVCEGASCRLEVTQQYRLHNRDRVKPAALRIKLAKPSPEARLEAPYHISFKGASPMPWEETAIRDIALSPDEQGTLEVTSRHDVGQGAFLEWAWDMSALANWGQVVSARVEWRLPMHVTEDIFLDIQPPPASFDGRTLVWEFEALTSPPRFRIAMIAPPVWQELRTLSAAEDHSGLAKRYLLLKDEAAQRRLTYPDPFEKILAELQLALANDTTRVEAHTLLADLYRRRAEAVPALRLNYLVLAAREYEALRALRPSDDEVAKRLSQTLFDAALTASEEGDPAGALGYLRQAQAVDARALPQSDVERLMLRWAVELALGGRAAQALGELEGALSPAMKESLFRYAPPFRWAHTEVFLAEGVRTVTYRLGLYELSAGHTREQLRSLAERVRGIPNCQAELNAPADSSSLEMTIRIRWGALAELRAASEAVAKACTLEDGFLASFVAAPWRTDLAVYEARPTWLTHEWRYEEAVDLSSVSSTWEAEALYSHWHLIEVRNASPLEERAVLERQLALAVLNDQARVWDGLPTACVWAYRTESPTGTPPRVLSWPVLWGDTKRLVGGQRTFRWGRALPLVGGTGVILGVGCLTRAFRRRD